MDHLGSGREWDLTRKNGGLNIVPPFASNTVKVYSGRTEALASILDFLRDAKEKYVVLSDANIAVNFDFKAMLNQHIESGADVTIAYSREKIPAGLRKPMRLRRICTTRWRSQRTARWSGSASIRETRAYIIFP